MKGYKIIVLLLLLSIGFTAKANVTPKMIFEIQRSEMEAKIQAEKLRPAIDKCMTRIDKLLKSFGENRIMNVLESMQTELSSNFNYCAKYSNIKLNSEKHKIIINEVLFNLITNGFNVRIEGDSWGMNKRYFITW